MKLVDLDPRFLRVREVGLIYDRVDTLAEAQGVEFICPACLRLTGAPTHRVRCWFDGRGAPVTESPQSGRWRVTSGTGIDDLSLELVETPELGCHWRGFVHHGEAIGA